MGRKFMLVSPQAVARMMQQGTAWLVVAGIPNDAKLVMASYDARKDVFIIVFESAEWNDVCEGCELERTDVEILDISEQYKDRNGREPGLSRKQA